MNEGSRARGRRGRGSTSFLLLLCFHVCNCTVLVAFPSPFVGAVIQDNDEKGNKEERVVGMCNDARKKRTKRRKRWKEVSSAIRVECERNRRLCLLYVLWRLVWPQGKMRGSSAHSKCLFSVELPSMTGRHSHIQQAAGATKRLMTRLLTTVISNAHGRGQ